MSRNLCITAVDGQTGHLIAELLLTDPNFSKCFRSVVGLALNVEHAHVQHLESLGAAIVPHQPGRERVMTKQLKDMGIDTICLIPPTHPDKYDITFELINAAKKANIPNVCFISAAGADLADPKKQPRLSEFIALEHLVLASKGVTTTNTGHSPVVIR
jgi:uroporphyrinogen-III synthase